MKLSDLKLSENNPRFIKDEKFKKLVKSIDEFPKMMELRPIVYDPITMVILGGNMRYRALKELKYKEIPDNWVKDASTLTEEEKKRFIIVDNVGFGDWDFDLLANEWDSEKLEDWGIEVPNSDNLVKKTEALKDFSRAHILISYHPDKHLQIQRILEQINNLDNIEIETASN